MTPSQLLKNCPGPVETNRIWGFVRGFLNQISQSKTKRTQSLQKAKIPLYLRDCKNCIEQSQVEADETDIPEEVGELHVLWCAVRTLGDDPVLPSLGDQLPIPVNLFLISEEEIPRRVRPKIKRDLPLRVAQNTEPLDWSEAALTWAV